KPRRSLGWLLDPTLAVHLPQLPVVAQAQRERGDRNQEAESNQNVLDRKLDRVLNERLCPGGGASLQVHRGHGQLFDVPLASRDDDAQRLSGGRRGEDENAALIHLAFREE